MHISAFQSLQVATKQESSPPAKGKGKGKEKAKSNFRDELKESETERRFKARKASLNKLFDAIGLRPVRTNSIIKSQKAAGSTMDSNQDALAHFDKSKKGKKDVKGKGKEVTPAKGEDDEEGDIGEKQVEAIYARASKNDMDLPCVSSDVSQHWLTSPESCTAR
jgi:hypothetical protein